MSITDLIPNARVAAIAGAVLALVLVGAGITWWGLSPRIELADERASRAEENLGNAHSLIEEQAAELATAQSRIEKINAIEQQMAALRQTISKNDAAQRLAVEELKKNDATVATYLAGLVPPALGRLYQRTETTDPAAYGVPAGVLADPVPAAGAGRSSEQ